MTKQKEKPNFNFAEILKSAVNEPGKILEAYSAFRGYSFQNTLLAMFQCESRQIAFGPIATFKHWQSKGRNVKKGEKAITLCCPVPFKKEVEKENGETETKSGMFFTFKNSWFVLSQTEGEDFKNDFSIEDWNQDLALKTLGIELIPFDMGDGNIQGFAKGKQVAVNPVAQLPLKTLFHEIAHVLHGHTDLALHDEQKPPRDIREVEAEATAMLCLAALGLPGIEYCRGYIQSWFKGNEIPEKSAKKIMQVADQILKAGRNEVKS